MTTLVTGGAGFIGSHIAERLLQQGERVIVLDNFNDYYDPNLKRANVQRLQGYSQLLLVEGDVRDSVLVERIFAEESVTHVAHMAAMAGVRNSMSQVALYMDVNLTGTMTLLNAAARVGIEQFVLASTSSVYGETKNLPFTETDAADRPLAAYPASKRAAEILAHTFHHLHGMNITALRFFNVYGENGRPDMMPMKLLRATQDGSVIKLFNGGNIARDWTYIEDTVEGVLNALQRPLGYEIINLGVGSPVSMREFVDIVETLSGKKIAVENVPTPPSDPPITFCNNQKARLLLGFEPRVKIQEGLERTWAWFKRVNGL